MNEIVPVPVWLFVPGIVMAYVTLCRWCLWFRDWALSKVEDQL